MQVQYCLITLIIIITFIIINLIRSWQVIQFDALPVTFVKIVGTNNTANEVSHIIIIIIQLV